jgi:hypothetical protein
MLELLLHLDGYRVPGASMTVTLTSLCQPKPVVFKVARGVNGYPWARAAGRIRYDPGLSVASLAAASGSALALRYLGFLLFNACFPLVDNGNASQLELAQQAPRVDASSLASDSSATTTACCPCSKWSIVEPLKTDRPPEDHVSQVP